MDECGVQEIGFAPPMGLEQDAVDVGQIDGFGVVADGFEQRGDAQIARPTQEAIGVSKGVRPYY